METGTDYIKNYNGELIQTISNTGNTGTTPESGYYWYSHDWTFTKAFTLTPTLTLVGGDYNIYAVTAASTTTATIQGGHPTAGESVTIIGKAFGYWY